MASTQRHAVYTADGSLPSLRNLALEDSPSDSQRAYSPCHTYTDACGESDSELHFLTSSVQDWDSTRLFKRRGLEQHLGGASYTA